MPIDKSWMAVKNRLSTEYKNGVKEFVEIGKAHVNAEGQMRCPCMNCLNRRFQAPRAVEMHLIQKGIQPSYTVWSFHGESFHKPPVHYPKDEVDEMADVLADLAGHGGYGETSNTFGGSVESGDEVTQPKDLKIMTRVLGPRSRHQKGYGSMPRLKAVGGNRAASSRGTYQDHEKDKIIATLKEQVATQAEQLATQAEQLAAQNNRLNEMNNVLAQMQKFIPGFHYQPPTTPSSATSNNPSND